MGGLTLILAGIGVWMLIEGTICALAPDFVRRLGAQLARLPARELALGGLIAAAIGAMLLILAVRAA